MDSRFTIKARGDCADLALVAVGMDLDLPFLLADLDRRLLGYLSVTPYACDDAHLGGFNQFDTYVRRGDVGLIFAAYEPYIKLAAGNAAVGKSAKIVTVISPSAKISRTATIGAGSIIQHGAYIGENAIVGSYVKVNVNASIHHGAKIGDFTTISPNCAILGQCTIGRESLIGAGSTIRNDVVVGDRVYLGMGAVVVANVPSDTVAYGVPAKSVAAFTPRTMSFSDS